MTSLTVRFAGAGYDEGPVAREVAHHFGLEYHELTVGPDRLLDRLRRASALFPSDLVRRAMYSDQHTFRSSIGTIG